MAATPPIIEERSDNSVSSTDSAQPLYGLDYSLPDVPPPSIDEYTFGDFIKWPLLHAFDYTYPVDGVDKIYKKHDGRKISKYRPSEKIRNSHDYRNHWGTRLASFLGLPTRQLNNEDNANSFANVFYNLMSWRDKTARWKNFFRSFLLPLNLIAVVFKFAINIVKLVTEFIPNTLERFFKKTAAKVEAEADQAYSDGKKGKWFSLSAVWWLLKGFEYTSRLAHYLGEALTSPIEHVRAALKRPKIEGGKEWVITVKRGAKAAVAIASTVLMFVITAPVAVTLFKATLLPLVVKHLPGFVTNSYAWLADKIGPIATTVGNAILENPVVAAVTHFLGLSSVYGASTAAAPIAAAVGLTIGVVGTPINALIDKFWIPFWTKPHPDDVNRKDPDTRRDAPIRLNDNIFTNTYGFFKSLICGSPRPGFTTRLAPDAYTQVAATDVDVSESGKQHDQQGPVVSSKALPDLQRGNWKDVRGNSSDSVRLGASKDTLLAARKAPPVATSKTDADPLYRPSVGLTKASV